MSRGRGLVIVALAVAALVVGWWLLSSTGRSPGGSRPTATVAPPSNPTAPALRGEARAKLLRDSPEAHLADNLNAPGGDIRGDLAIVGSLVTAYRSFYPGRGNPVGDNRDLTETFLGRNPNGIILLQAGHRAINARGELCDRWGTPFFFHAESGTRMEIRSAGPDRQFRTDDDIMVIP